MPSFCLVTLKFIRRPIFPPGHFHVRQQLGCLNAHDLLDTLQLRDQLVLDEKVDSVSTIEPNVLVLHRKRVLELKRDVAAIPCVGHTWFVSRCEQPRPKVPVYFDGATDHAVRELAEFHLRALRVLRGCCICVPCSTL